jgi:hypothetical protein
MNDIEVTDKLQASTEKNINGNGYKLTFKDDQDGWSSNYVLQFYKTKGSIKNLSIAGGDAAILVNGSDVTLKGTVDVSGNEFGGIEVSQGEGVTKEPKLTVNGTLTFAADEDLPAIWIDGKTSNGDWVAGKGIEGLFTKKIEDEYKKQFWFVTTDLEDPDIDGSDTTFTKDSDDNYVLTVKASDNVQLKELEIDHSYGNDSSTPEENQIPEFSVYADKNDPYGGKQSKFNTAGVVVTYDDGTWKINFGDSNQFADKLGEDRPFEDIEFYLVVRDIAGNASGSMYDGSYYTVNYNSAE